MILRDLRPLDLLKCGELSKAFFAYSEADELWERIEYDFKLQKPSREVPLPVVKVYSDLLYYSWLYMTLDYNQFLGDNLERRSVKDLTFDEFFEKYDKGNIPVVLTDVVEQWPALKLWTMEKLTPHYRRLVSGLKKPSDKRSSKFESFYTNMYHFAQHSPHNSVPAFIDDQGNPRAVQLSDFFVPSFFEDDIFSVLGDTRPQQFRWLLLGAKGSGSSFHQDPHFTSAWNASIVGRKKFVMLRGDQVPPGVEALGGDDFRPPSVVLQWFVEHYHTLEPGSFYECVIHPHECIFVPSGWWHTVLNLDNTIAVTQNFVDKANLANVVQYLNYSDCALHDRFVAALNEKRPELSSLLSPKKSAWDSLVGDDDDSINFVLSL